MSMTKQPTWVVYDPTTLEELGTLQDRDDAFAYAEGFVDEHCTQVTISMVGRPEQRYSAVLTCDPDMDPAVIVLHDPPEEP